ncbi:MAG: hypothetical protein CK547_04270, partial [Chitinophagaceae bacterium]
MIESIQEINNQLIVLFVAIPLLSFVATLFWKNKQENSISGIVQITKSIYIIWAVGYFILWGISGSPEIHLNLVTIYESNDFVFAIHFYYDRITAVFSLLGAVSFFLVTTFSRYYMHRDEGYKRFFNTILFFAFGYNLIIFSGNFETLFLGWEFIGLSSFLLIAFYRNRYLPVKNAFKVLSNYRLSDVALMLMMWMMHHLTHSNIDFTELSKVKIMVTQNKQETMAIFIVIMILISAMIKSAQIPFTSWLPRAMEGPTTSSAIFYGSLSVHIGTFLLLRTYSFWEDMLWFKYTIVFIGLATAVISTHISRVQPTVKTQIAYSSAAQIGIIFIEIALGFHFIALIHIAGNAFLRTYQLLVSPSVLNYLIHNQYFHYHPTPVKKLTKFKATFFILGIKEWGLDQFFYRYLYTPFKWIGKQFDWVKKTKSILIIFILGIISVVYFLANDNIKSFDGALSISMLTIALFLVLFSFSYRGSALRAWGALMVSHIFILAGISNNEKEIKSVEVFLYISGILISFIIGSLALYRVKKIDKDISLNQYHGYVYEEKNTA